MIEAKNILTKFTQRWQLLLYLEVFLYALGSAILVYFLSTNLLFAVLGFILISALMSFIKKPWQPNIKASSSFIDNHAATLEHSTSLLLKPSENLSSLAMLQQQKIVQRLSAEVRNISPPNNLIKSCIVAVSLILIGFLAYQFNLTDYFTTEQSPINKKDVISFQPTDSTDLQAEIPKLLNQSLTIYYPNYTNLRASKSSTMDVIAVEGSRISWELEFNDALETVSIENIDNSYAMELKDGKYTYSLNLTGSSFYNFKFSDKKGNTYFSDLYAIEVTKDEAPTVDIKGIEQFTQFEFTDYKTVQFNSEITDDYGLNEAYIIATVSKGTGESVKFREEQLSFDTSLKRGAKSQNLSKTINLEAMKMEPGDELYFYVQASDLKTPKPNISRSETYFVAIKDTTTNTFGVEGTLGVDRMPDYFRSQRQLIIDTEKLIKQRGQLSKKDFNFTSNELGFDQKALRIKYGEFMGEEQAEEEGVITQDNLEDFEAENEHHGEEGEEDLLAAYTHDHDGSNEHNLVEEKKERESENPLEAFAHSHDDAEMATLFEESLRSKLLKALGEMWDSELYLRLYEPEKSLPYQYRALTLLQDIKNSARIYVHRIGFDPPPIKEDTRLSGKLEDINSYRKNETLENEVLFPSIRTAIYRIEQIINNNSIISERDQSLFERAGNELAQKAIENPGQFLQTLQELKQLSENKDTTLEMLRTIQKGLIKAIPSSEFHPSKSDRFSDQINQLLLKELEIHD
ncbi:MAG: tryptophan-rich sensory protein [Flavobacteriaceae bacterium]|nr:tryptophan-rich sensory protein [Flavobacteriaceae bacterium]